MRGRRGGRERRGRRGRERGRGREGGGKVKGKGGDDRGFGKRGIEGGEGKGREGVKEGKEEAVGEVKVEFEVVDIINQLLICLFLPLQALQLPLQFDYLFIELIEFAGDFAFVLELIDDVIDLMLQIPLPLLLHQINVFEHTDDLVITVIINADTTYEFIAIYTIEAFLLAFMNCTVITLEMTRERGREGRERRKEGRGREGGRGREVTGRGRGAGEERRGRFGREGMRGMGTANGRGEAMGAIDFDGMK